MNGRVVTGQNRCTFIGFTKTFLYFVQILTNNYYIYTSNLTKL